MKFFAKIKKWAQRAGTNAGWNRHVDKYNKRKGNKRIRRVLKKESYEE